MTIRTSITRRERTRVLSSGIAVRHTRYILNYRDPRTGKRRQLFFRSQRDAIAKRDAILAAIATNSYREERTSMTVAGAIEHWLENRKPEIKAPTWETYRRLSSNNIIGPLLIGTPAERGCYRAQGVRPEGTHFVDALGSTKIADLTTGDIRRWHRLLLAEVGSRTAGVCKTYLRAALALAAEDFGVRPPPLPTKLGRGCPKTKRVILTPAQVGVLLRAAQADPLGIYYAWPFLTGTRPSEQLAVLWEAVDLDRSVVSICRMQERNGILVQLTKTEAGTREIPLSPMVCEMLLRWRSICPYRHGEPHRVFPGPAGGSICYRNWLRRIFKPALLRIGVPYVTPPSARHSFISVLQASGTEIGLIAKLAGHSNPSVTLGHYTRAVRKGDAAIADLEAAYMKDGGQ
jgi:integrase